MLGHPRQSFQVRSALFPPPRDGHARYFRHAVSLLLQLALSPSPRAQESPALETIRLANISKHEPNRLPSSSVGLSSLKVLHTNFHKGWGGQSNRILTVCQGLAARGHAVTVAAPAGSELARRAAQSGLDVFSGVRFSRGLRPRDLYHDVLALRGLIRYYTREAGVRNLERELANLARKAVKKIISTKVKAIDVTMENLGDFAGVRKFRYGEIEGEDQVGVVTGLAWTEAGGDTLTIESVVVPGKGRFQATGRLGEVMKESIDAARSYARSRAATFGIEPTVFGKRDIHVHVPEGATPKDGPSAGVAMATSIISVLTGIAVKRDVAMTGEITLRGRVLPIGGLKEKLLAALRTGLTTVIIPAENEKDLAEVPDNVKSGLKICPVDTMEEVLKIALVRQPIPIEWEEPDGAPVPPAGEGGAGKDTVVTH
ncbi:hypothetical protein IIC65_02490 [Candidatus Sumerlaeota bacterium]|nr:hypothetical protein [Candidatus Sumerlaeota bacterium]